MRKTCCDLCGGEGVTRRPRWTASGKDVIISACPRCLGTGKPPTVLDKAAILVARIVEPLVPKGGPF